MTPTMSTAGRFTEIRHTSKDPLPFAAERQMAKKQTENDGKGRDLVCLGQRVKRH